MRSSKLTIEAWPLTDAGQATENEDYVLIYQPSDPQQARYSGTLYVVADGSGGGIRGQMASRYAAHKVMYDYYNSDEPDLGLRLRDAVAAANADLFAYAQQRPELVKLSTTLVAAVIRGEALHVASVGDSRVYLIRDGRIHRITRDHTLVQQLLDEGAITPEEARDHPRRDVVLRVLGAQRDLSIDVFDLRLKPDDALVLCTDGLTRVLQDEEIAQIVATRSPRSAAETLLQKVQDRGGKDNVTIVSALVRDGGPPLETNIPHVWDGSPPSFEEQQTLIRPRTQVPGQGAAPSAIAPLDLQRATEPPQGAADTMPMRRVTPDEAAPPPADWTQAGQPTLPVYQQGVQPAPSYETPVQPAPPYREPSPQVPQAPLPPPAPPQAPPQAPPGYYAPPGYAIDPVTGLPPVPPTQTAYGPPAPVSSYAPRIYQPPARPNVAPPRQGVPVGLVALAGVLAVILTALMVFILVNPFNWQMPSIGGLPGARPTATGVAEALPTPSPTADIPPTAPPEATPTQPEPTPIVAPPGMVLIEGGPFTRGVSNEEAQAAILACINESADKTLCYPEYFTDAQPVAEITLSPFFIDVTEVTNLAYAECVAAERCTPPRNQQFYADPAFAQHPVVYVTWDQARIYCEWAGKRLPTEAEWEKAARWDPQAGEARVYPWGNEFIAGVANTDAAGLGGTSAVQAFAQDISPWGVLGMGGNVSEWTADWYFPGYERLGTLNPTGPETQPLPEPFRVVRGGSFLSLSPFARAGQRFDVNPNQAARQIGFRCAASVVGAEAPPAPAGVEVTPTITPTGEAILPSETPVP